MKPGSVVTVACPSCGAQLDVHIARVTAAALDSMQVRVWLTAAPIEHECASPPS